MQFGLDNLPFLGQARGFAGFNCPVPLHYYDLPTNMDSEDPLTEGVGGSFLPINLYELQLTSILSSDEKGAYLYWSDADDSNFQAPIDKYLIVKYDRNTQLYESVLEVNKDKYRTTPYQIYLDGHPKDYYPNGNYYFSIYLLIAYDIRGCPVCFSNVAQVSKSLITKPKPVVIYPPTVTPIVPICPPVVPPLPPTCIEISPTQVPFVGQLQAAVPGARFSTNCSTSTPWPPTPPISTTFPIIPPPPPPLVINTSTWGTILAPWKATLKNGFGKIGLVTAGPIQQNIPLSGGSTFHSGSLQISSNGVTWTTLQNFIGAIPTNFSPINLSYGSTYYFRFVVKSNLAPNNPYYHPLGSITASPLITTTLPTLTQPITRVQNPISRYPASSPRGISPLLPFTLTIDSFVKSHPYMRRYRRVIGSFTNAGTPNGPVRSYSVEISTDNIKFSLLASINTVRRSTVPAVCGRNLRCFANSRLECGKTYYLRVTAYPMYPNISPVVSNTVTISDPCSPVADGISARAGRGRMFLDAHGLFINENYENSNPLKDPVSFWIDDNVSANKINLFYLKESGVSGVEYKVQYTQKEGASDLPNEFISPDTASPCIEPSGFFINDVFVYSGATRLTPTSGESINLKDVFEIYYDFHPSRSSADQIVDFNFFDNSSGLSGIEKVGGWFYHFAKKVGFESTGPYHAVGNNVDGIGLFLGTSRSIFETGYLEEAPASGFIEAYNEKMGYGTGSGILGASFGTITNNGTKNDLCWDPFISKSAMVEISYDLSNVENFRGIIDGSIYNIASGGAITEIGKIEYINTDLVDSLSFSNPSSIINKYYINITGFLNSSDGYGCSICNNARLSGSSGSGNSLNFEVIHDVSGFNFAADSTGVLRFSGIYKKYDPLISCLSEVDLGEVESVEYVEDVPYRVVDHGNSFFCAPTGGCTTKELGSSVVQGINFTGKFYEPPESFWALRVANTGTMPVSMSAYRINVSGSGSIITDYTGISLNEDGVSLMSNEPGVACGSFYGCSVVCTGETGVWNISEFPVTPFSVEIDDKTTDFFIVLCRTLLSGAVAGSDSINEDLKYVRSSQSHILNQEMVDRFNKFVNYRSGINIPLACPTFTSTSLKEFHRDYSLDDFEEVEYQTNEECETTYVDVSIDSRKIEYNPVKVKVKNESNLPVLFSIGAGRFKTNYGVVDPSGGAEGKPPGNIGEFNFNQYTLPIVYCGDLTYPTGRLGHTAPNGGESTEFLIDPYYDFVLLHVHRVAYNEASSTVVSRPTQAHSQINELYLISKSGVPQEVRDYFSDYSSGYFAAVPPVGTYPLENYGRMSAQYNQQDLNGGVAGFAKARIFEIESDWEKNKNILLTYSHIDSLVNTLSGTFSGFDNNWPLTGPADSTSYQYRREPNLVIPSTSGYHFKFIVNEGISYHIQSFSYGSIITTGTNLTFMNGQSVPTYGSNNIDILYGGFHASDGKDENLVTLYGVLSSGSVAYDFSGAASFGEYTTGIIRDFNGYSDSITPTIAERAANIHSRLDIQYSGNNYVAGRAACPAGAELGVIPVEKDRNFEIVLRTGNELNAYIEGLNRTISATYDNNGDLSNFITSHLFESVSIGLYRVDHQVSIENYGPEQFEC